MARLGQLGYEYRTVKQPGNMRHSSSLDEDIQKLGLGGEAGNAQDESSKREGQAAEKGPRVEAKELKFDDLVSKADVLRAKSSG